ADGRRMDVAEVGFRRRVVYAPLKPRDLRIGNSLFLRLTNAAPENAEVAVLSPDSTRFAGRMDSLRLSPVLHVNQVGYMPGYPKEAMVGYYLGSLGELDMTGVSAFRLIDCGSGKTAFEGLLTP